MRILMLTPRFPYPPDRGDTLRSWSLVSGLAQRHEVWLACVDTAEPRPEHLERVEACCRAVAVFARPGLRRLCRGALGMLRGASLTAGYFHDPRLVDTVRRWSRAADFDALLTYSSAMAPAAAAATARRRVLDLCDVDSVKWETYARRSLPPLRWLYRAEARRVARLEGAAARAHAVCLLVNERERRKLLARAPDVRTGVLPTAVDLDDYADPAAMPPLPAEPVVGLIGSMFYPPNVRAVNWFGRHVWPAVREAVPAARWLIVGSRPVRAVRRWGRLPGVTVTGYVRDMRPYLESMRVVVNAVDNDIGVQSKLVVALAAGRPAVVTPQAAAGLVYEDPPPFVVAAAPTAFAAAVVRVLRDEAHARALAARARAVAAAQYSAAEVVRRAEHWLAGAEPKARPGTIRAGLAALGAVHEVVGA